MRKLATITKHRALSRCSVPRRNLTEFLSGIAQPRGENVLFDINARAGLMSNTSVTCTLRRGRIDGVILENSGGIYYFSMRCYLLMRTYQGYPVRKLAGVHFNVRTLSSKIK